MQAPKLTKSLLLLSLLAAASGCGIDFKVADQSDESRKESEVIQSARPLNVAKGNQPAVPTSLRASKVGILKGTFNYAPSEDQTLAFSEEDFVHRKCGGDTSSIKPKYTWQDVTPVAEGEALPPPESIRPYQKFPARAGRTYVLGIEMETSFGRCDDLGISIIVRAVTGDPQ